ncbi:MAG TPA: DNA polymerase Y family protein [Devosia sp.]|nr:DNA polymerase Y family protein [Devosia sp.]
MSLWLNRLPSQRLLRIHPYEGVFVVVQLQGNAWRLHCLNGAAEAAGLSRGMSLADARALCPDLKSIPADLSRDLSFLRALARWAQRYSPVVSMEEDHRLLLDISGAAHLFGGEEALLSDLLGRLARSGLTARAGVADTPVAARALARFGSGQDIAPPGRAMDMLETLPVRALGLEEKTCISLQRLGVTRIGQLVAMEREGLLCRFGQGLLVQLDRARGEQQELIVPEKISPVHRARMSLAEPVGLVRDVERILERLLERVCRSLEKAQQGARRMRLTARRVDRGGVVVTIGLARPMRSRERIGRLFERDIRRMEAGFGIDRLTLEALDVVPLPLRQLTHQLTHGEGRQGDDLADLISRIGNRVGFENVRRYLPAQSHIPEKSFIVSAAAFSAPVSDWTRGHLRPLIMFAPEPLAVGGRDVPHFFTWRGMRMATVRALGPERILAEWWLDDPGWRSGMRDYWFVQTRQGRRLWLFHTPREPAWFVTGEFA